MTSSLPTIEDLALVARKLDQSPWLIACLCAAWCDTCQTYRKNFEAVQQAHPDKIFTWVDIEDQSALVEELDIENFPTILIEYQGKVLFLGTMLPDANLVHKLINSYAESIEQKPIDTIQRSIQASNQGLPNEWSLRLQLKKHFCAK